MTLNHTGHEVYKCARVAGHTKKFVFQWFEFVCYINVICCICKIYIIDMYGNVWFQCKSSECLVSLSSLVCLAWVVFSDLFIATSCYYQTKIFAGLLICVLATSLLFFQGQRVIFFSHTYSSLQSSCYAANNIHEKIT